MIKKLLIISLIMCQFVKADPREYDQLKTEIGKISKELNLLQKQFYGNNKAPNSANTGYVQMDEVDQQIRNNNGRLEVLEHRLKEVNTRLDKAFLDIEFRLTKLEKLAVALPLPTENILAERKANDQELNLANYDVNQEKLNEYKSSQSSSNKNEVKKSTLAPEKEKQGQLVYNKALALYRQKKYPDSIKQFEGFLNEYKGHSLYSNAQYWLGENYYDLGRFEYASIQYINSLKTNYKDGQKSADSIFKLVISLNKLGKVKQACVYYNKLKLDFPDSIEVLKSKKEYSELAKIKCE